MDVKRAADLYAQGWTLRRIATELGVTETTVSDQLRRVVIMRRPGPPAHSASTEQIVELRDQSLTWNEIAEHVDMTVSGAWSRYRRARPPKPPRLGRRNSEVCDKNTRRGAGRCHYYALSGPSLLIEYGNTQDGANHIHSVWRDLRRDFAGDLLAQHYAGVRLQIRNLRPGL